MALSVCSFRCWYASRPLFSFEFFVLPSLKRRISFFVTDAAPVSMHVAMDIFLKSLNTEQTACEEMSEEISEGIMCTLGAIASRLLVPRHIATLQLLRECSTMTPFVYNPCVTLPPSFEDAKRAQLSILWILVDHILHSSFSVRSMAYSQISNIANCQRSVFLRGATILSLTLCCRSMSTAELVRIHGAPLYLDIIRASVDSPTIIAEVCDSLLDLDIRSFFSEALPLVIPHIIEEQNMAALREV